ncbi:MAG: hypothetical protein ACRDWW_01565, partial [Acidimicrobiales bacterium]
MRIVRADEAQAALEAGEAAGRRPDDELRFGDVPPAPQGPRPAHRFPLSESVDPAGAAPLPPLAVPKRSFGRTEGSDGREGPAEWAGDPVPPAAPSTGWGSEDRTAELGVPGQPPGTAPAAPPAQEAGIAGAPQPRLEPAQPAWEPASPTEAAGTPPRPTWEPPR